VNLEIHDGVALLTMNAGKANAIGSEWLDRMRRLVEEVSQREARALVLTGYETFFSAGLDLPSLVSLSRSEMETFIGRFGDLMLELFLLPLPVVAAVNGHAVAGGCVLALQADVRIMADRDARIGLNEVALGIGLPAVVVETLRCQVPAASLLPIAVEGKLLSPGEAHALGLVHEVVAGDRLVERALARARELAALPGPAFRHIKGGIRGPIAERMRSAARDSERWVDTWVSPEGQERVRAAVARLASRKK
jgi:enoyl-CoA hydratase